MRRLNGLFNVYWKNTKSVLGELQDSCLAGFLFGGGKISGVVASILLLIAILRTWAMDNGLIFYEQCMVLLYLMLQMYEFEKRHNREGKRPNKKICWEVFLEFVALETASLMIVTLLKSWKMKVEYSERFKFRLLNFSLNDCSSEGIFKDALAGHGLLLQVAKGLAVRDLTVLNYYESLGKATLDKRIIAYEDLLSTDDVHYIPGSLITLGLQKQFEGANQLAIVEGCEEMFHVGEEFKGGLVNAETALCPLTTTIMVVVGSSSTSFLACLIITSGTISIEGFGTSSLRGYVNVTVVLDQERRSYHGRKYMLGINLVAATDYPCHGLTPVIHYYFRPSNSYLQGTLNESKVLTTSLEFMITRNLYQHGSTMSLRTRSISSGKDCYDRELVIKRISHVGLVLTWVNNFQLLFHRCGNLPIYRDKQVVNRVLGIIIHF